jgi:hypothetical protein
MYGKKLSILRVAGFMWISIWMSAIEALYPHVQQLPQVASAPMKLGNSHSSLVNLAPLFLWILLK